MPARKKHKREQDRAREQQLEGLLFGSDDIDRFVPFGTEAKDGADDEAVDVQANEVSGDVAHLTETITSADDAALFTLDTSGDIVSAPASAPSAPSALWTDPDDETHMIDLTSAPRLRKLRKNDDEMSITAAEYVHRLRSVYGRLNGSSPWHIDVTDNGDAADDIERRDDFLHKRSATLLTGKISVSPCKDANIAAPAKSVLHSVDFHPNGSLMMCAGLDKTVRLFNIDGRSNPLLQGIHIDDMPVRAAAFINNGTEVICTGRRSYFYAINIETGTLQRIPNVRGRTERSWESFTCTTNSSIIALFGRDGHIVLLDSKSKQSIGSLKMNGSVRGLSISSDGGRLVSVGSDSEIYVWDVAQRSCMSRVTDGGQHHSTAVAFSADQTLIATGGDSGIVNVHKTANIVDGDGKSVDPIRCLTQLTTPISTITFNHDSSLMAIASSKTKDALRLIHVPSLTAFTNFPSQRTPLSYVTDAAFSPHSGYMTIGNDRGRALLYRLNHFANA